MYCFVVVALILSPQRSGSREKEEISGMWNNVEGINILPAQDCGVPMASSCALQAVLSCEVII